MADVAGHGQEVQGAADGLRRLMRKHINHLDHRGFVRELNEGFLAESDDGRFATALVTTFFLPTEQLAVSNAGHPRPLLFRAETRTWIDADAATHGVVESASNLPLGIMDSVDYDQFAVRLDAGDMLLLTSDGVADTKLAAGGRLGDAGLRTIVESIDDASAEGFGRAVIAEIDRLRGTIPLADDFTLIVLRRNAAGSVKRTFGDVVRALGKMIGLIEV